MTSKKLISLLPLFAVLCGGFSFAQETTQLTVAGSGLGNMEVMQGASGVDLVAFSLSTNEPVGQDEADGIVIQSITVGSGLDFDATTIDTVGLYMYADMNWMMVASQSGSEITGESITFSELSVFVETGASLPLIVKVDLTDTVATDSYIHAKITDIDGYALTHFTPGTLTIEGLPASSQNTITITEPIVCGNGQLQEGEMCDDGNTTNGDGCDSSCQIEGSMCQDYFGAYATQPAMNTEMGCINSSYFDLTDTETHWRWTCFDSQLDVEYTCQAAKAPAYCEVTRDREVVRVGETVTFTIDGNQPNVQGTYSVTFEQVGGGGGGGNTFQGDGTRYTTIAHSFTNTGPASFTFQYLPAPNNHNWTGVTCMNEFEVLPAEQSGDSCTSDSQCPQTACDIQSGQCMTTEQYEDRQQAEEEIQDLLGGLNTDTSDDQQDITELLQQTSFTKQELVDGLGRVFDAESDQQKTVIDEFITTVIGSSPTITNEQLATFLQVVNSTDNDGDTIPDMTERLAPNNGDANFDGTRDDIQANVSTVPTKKGTDKKMTIAAGGLGCNQITEFVASREEDFSKQDGKYDYLYGMNRFTVACSSATIRIFYHGLTLPELQAMPYRKYSVPTKTYTNLPVTYGSEGGVPYVEFTITDGSMFDDSPAGDGIVKDDNGPATKSENYIKGGVVSSIPKQEKHSGSSAQTTTDESSNSDTEPAVTTPKKVATRTSTSSERKGRNRAAEETGKKMMQLMEKLVDLSEDKDYHGAAVFEGANEELFRKIYERLEQIDAPDQQLTRFIKIVKKLVSYDEKTLDKLDIDKKGLLDILQPMLEQILDKYREELDK